MTRVILCMIGLAAFAGCDLVKPKVDNPVLGPPPPRVSMSNEPARGGRFEKAVPNARVASNDREGRVRTIDFNAARDLQTGELSGAQVVATVNGAPIFASEVLEPYGSALRNAKQKVSPEDFQKIRDGLIQKHLKDHIQRKLLAEALRARLEGDQLKRLDEAINAMYADYVEGLKKQLKVNSEPEVELELEKQGTSLARLKNGFAVQAMARAYLDGNAKPNKTYSRHDLLAYYEAHAKDYEYPEKVRWQQISISFAAHGGRAGALERLELAVDELRRSVDFGEVARRYSDGPNAQKGGDFGWTQPDSLADDRVRQVLQELPEGMISRVLEGKDDFRLVKVNERKPAGRVPFEQVYAKIKQKLESESEQAATQKMLDELLDQAVVETIYDEKQG